MPAEPAADEPVAPTDESLSSKTAEPDPDYSPTENPHATIVPGQMRSDREEIPAGATKEMADLAETMEAKKMLSRAAPGCQNYWPFPYDVCGAIKDKYNALGGPGSFLSYPNSPEYTNPDGFGKRTQFLNGPIYWSAATGAHPVVNSFLNRWGVYQYEAGWLKYPTTDEILLPDGGRRQEFQFGAIYVAFQNAIGSAIRNGPVRDKWNTVGGNAPGGSFLGYVTGDEIVLPDGQGHMARFERGVIYWSPSTGAFPVSGDILAIWADEGYEASSFGYPVSDQSTTSASMLTQQFQNGSLDVQTYPAEQAASSPEGSFCFFTTRSDRVHRSTSRDPNGVLLPPTASAHGWWTRDDCPLDVRANVTSQLQILSPTGVWVDRGAPTTVYGRDAGSGKGKWAAVNSLCNGFGPLTWRVVVDVDLVDYDDTTERKYSDPVELPCS